MGPTLWVHSGMCENNEEVKQSKPSESSEPIDRSYNSAISDPLFQRALWAEKYNKAALQCIGTW